MSLDGIPQPDESDPGSANVAGVDYRASKSATLSKSVFSLAIEPLTMALTVTGRKAYDVMLWIAQRSQPTDDGGYSSPVSSIVNGYGSSTKNSDRAQRYIEQMVQTTVVWRALSVSDQHPFAAASLEGRTLQLEGFEAVEGESTSGRGDARTFPLLAEARLYRRGGEAWVTWYYPPSIREHLISPERWAQIELNSIARLSTYTAVALYEICARYKDSPGGLTGRHDADFWFRVLRERAAVKPREFRKFKNEMLSPAIVEINELTEISIELIEHRKGKSLESIQFAVKRKPRRPGRSEPMPPPADDSLAVRSAALGIREHDCDALMVRFGSPAVSKALDAMHAHVSEEPAAKIMNPAGYLRAILSNELSTQSTRSAASAPEQRPTSRAAAELRATDGGAENAPRDDKDALYRRLSQEFSALTDEERAKWIDQVEASLSYDSVVAPAMRKRLRLREWKSPLVNRLVLDAYAMGSVLEKF